jgi:hypothetical protein
MISQGSFRARATSLTFGKSPEKGTPCAIVMFLLQEGPEAGHSIEWIGYLTEKTEQQTAESMSRCGYDGGKDETICRNEVQLVIENESYTNKAGETKERPRVRWINDLSGAGRFESMTGAEVAGVKDRLKAAMLAAKAKAAAAKAPAAGGVNEPNF